MSGRYDIASYVDKNMVESIESPKAVDSPYGVLRLSMVKGKAACSIVGGTTPAISELQNGGKKESHMAISIVEKSWLQI